MVEIGTALIAVGVPVWRGADFVAETLRSVLRQSHGNFRLLISVDGADGESERVCLPFAADPRVRIVVQEKRLGWVGNTAALYAAGLAEGAAAVCIQPHDDLVEPDYLAVLAAALDRHPAAAVAYCDIEAFGTTTGILDQDSVTGPPLRRMLAMLYGHYKAVAYRGLVRATALARLPPISGNTASDFSADTVWMTRLATVGELVRVPRVLYRKRFHAGNTHVRWDTWSRTQKIAAWKQHCVSMLGEALTVAANLEARLQLVDAARRRLLQSGPPTSPFREIIVGLPTEARERLAAEFDRDVASMLQSRDGRPSGIGPPRVGRGRLRGVSGP